MNPKSPAHGRRRRTLPSPLSSGSYWIRFNMQQPTERAVENQWGKTSLSLTPDGKIFATCEKTQRLIRVYLFRPSELRHHSWTFDFCSLASVIWRKTVRWEFVWLAQHVSLCMYQTRQVADREVASTKPRLRLGSVWQWKR